MAHRLPSFDALVAVYPHRETPAAIKQKIGGAIDDTHAPAGPQQWLGGPEGDTCTIRMSRAFNYAGAVIPKVTPHLVTVAGGDHKTGLERIASLNSKMGPHLRPV